MTEKLDWNLLQNAVRRKDRAREAKDATIEGSDKREGEKRIEHERDHDRILFSAPLRRLQDKTQVFPLEKNDSVRTRLTHSHEVANMARSIGTTLAFDHAEELGFQKPDEARRSVPALLEAIGLAHDLGNPPFGHQGEAAIRTWVAKNAVTKSENQSSRDIFSGWKPTEAQKQDFLQFEGNAQALRLLTRLQVLNDGFGLNMTYAFLAALMKYPVPSDKIDDKSVASKKFGFFQSETDIVAEVWRETGLREGVRHPLTYIMEACDDIAYSVVDVEDGARKGLLNFNKLVDYLGEKSPDDELTRRVIGAAEKEYRRALKSDISPSAVDDISMQMFRVHAIGAMVPAAIKAFLGNKDSIMAGTFTTDLMKQSDASHLWGALKKFAVSHIYKQASVLIVESEGHKVIHSLMDMLWDSINAYEAAGGRKSRNQNPTVEYTYFRISENYRRVYEDDNNSMPYGYKRLQLVTDMISGMTDSFAVALCEDLRRCHAS